MNKDIIKEPKDSIASKKVHLKDLEFHCYGDSKEERQKDWDEINELLEKYDMCNSAAYICHFFCQNDTALYNQIKGESVTSEQDKQQVDWFSHEYDY